MIALAGVVTTLSLGLSLGAVGGLLGIGGGLIAIPLLAKGYGMDQSMAQGTALVMIVPNVLIGFLRYRQRHDLAWARVAALVLPAVVAAWVSSRFAVALDADHLRLLFAGFLVVIAAVMLLHRPRAQAAAAAPRTPGLARWLLPLVGLASGVMSGLFTVGGGLVVVPLLVLLLDTPQVEAQGLALAAVVPGALVALLSYAQAGRVDWAVGGPLALGGVFTVSFGVAWAHRLSPAVLRGAFTAVLLGTACALSV